MNKNKPVVLITGAAGGIGKACCEIFYENNYRVIAIDRNEIQNEKYDCFQFDISELHYNKSKTQILYSEIEKIIEGNLNVIINNAALQIVKSANEINADDWDNTLKTNLLAPFWLIQKFLNPLKNAKGSIVNIASIHASLTKKGFSMYATSKGALVSLTRALAIELAPHIRVNAVIPAATDTPMLRDGFKGDDESLDRLGKYHPLGRIAAPEEVAQVALFLAGNQASFVTGSVYNVDGGIGSCLHDPIEAR